MPEIRIISLGTKLPVWVNSAVETYLSRLPRQQFEATLIEIPSQKRTTTSNLINILRNESRQVLERIPKDYVHISLDRTGKKINSKQLSQTMQNWLDNGQNAAISIGGPEGFPKTHFQQCQQVWSLSDLTLAHPVARVVLAEQLFRAWSIMIGHPYHRGEQY